MNTIRVGARQLQLLQSLWKRGRASARDIGADLNQTEFVAHSTVQTLLRQLERKGAIAHDVEDRTFIYRAVVDEAHVLRSKTEELVQKVFGGSVKGLVAHLLQHEKISKKEIREIRKLINEHDQES